MMLQHSRLFRLSATVALGGLLCNAALPVIAAAQPAPGPPPVTQLDQPPGQTQADPPDRVGRVARLTGTVSFRTTGDTQWARAAMNYPVASGNAFWTEPAAEANLEVSSSRIALAPQTEFDVTTLDAGGLQAVAPQGEIYLQLRDLAPNEVWSIQTPRGQVRLTAGGRYGVVAGTTDQPTLVTVVDGAAEIEGPGVSLQIGANQTATIVGGDPFQGSVGAATRDAFLTTRLNAERPPPRQTVAIPAPMAAQVAEMPGGEDLTGYGSWAPAPQYGQVWYPPVSPGWVPYREGHWAYVTPWGWTWVDDAPWGFAPFHYGRWVQVDSRWGWTPGLLAASEPPVYAPALVTFLGLGVGVAAGIGLGAALANGRVGWVPLGPREAYHPWYHASDRYVRNINVTHVNNVTTINTYINRGGATVVPTTIMTGSRPVQGRAQPMTAQAFAEARPVFGQQPVRPTAATLGVTPAVARQMNLTRPVGAPEFRPAPGPAVRAQTFGRGAVAPGAVGPGAVGPGAVGPGAVGPGAGGAAGIGPAIGAPGRPSLVGPQGEPPNAGRPNAAVSPGPRGLTEPARPALAPPGARPAGMPPAANIPPGPAAVPQPARLGSDAVPGPRPSGFDRPNGIARPGAPTMPGGPAAAVAGTMPRPGGPSPVAVPRVEAPRPAPSGVAPAPAIAPPRAAAPRVETPRVETPRFEAPRVPAPRFEAPRMEAPRVQMPQPMPPRIEAPRPQAAPRFEAPRPIAPQARPEPPRQKRPGEP